MHYPKRAPFVCLAFYLILAVGVSAAAAQLSQKPEDVSTLETTKALKVAYRVATQTLKSLEYEIKGKKKNAYLYGIKRKFLLTEIMADRNGNFRAAGGSMEEYRADLWLEQTADGKVLISMRVVKQDFQINASGPVTPRGESERMEDEESSILQKLGGNLK